jgi:cytosine/adenosine deaminase-related metal-dependent hydrolase
VILRARWVAPVAGGLIRDGFVRFQTDRILTIGRESELSGVVDDVLDLGEALITPGLVNPHTHLELGCYAGMFSPGPFWPWITRLARIRAEPGRLDQEQAAAEEWGWRSLRSGVTCVGDISRANVAWRSLKSVPIRKVCFVELLSRASVPPRNPAELREQVALVEEDELLTVGVTPHAPYTVPEPEIRAAIALADELDLPWTTHWAETAEEVQFLAGQRAALPEMLRRALAQCGVDSPRLRPIEYLNRCGEGLSAGALAHVNYIANEELDALARSGHTVVYCPRAHHFFGHTPHPLPRLRAAGVPVALGTDSPASNDGVSMLAELHHVWKHVGDPPSFPELLRMATLDAARALRLERSIGSLEPGKQADVAAWECRPDESAPLRAWIESPASPLGVWVSGRRVV